ncbi:hypothetical protein MRX96_000681 [Rhipicephalus microplus]
MGLTRDLRALVRKRDATAALSSAKERETTITSLPLNLLLDQFSFQQEGERESSEIRPHSGEAKAQHAEGVRRRTAAQPRASLQRAWELERR